MTYEKLLEKECSDSFNCRNGWKKLVDSRIREIKHRKSGIVPSCNQRIFSFNKDSDYVFDI